MLKKLRTNALTLGTFALMGAASVVYLSAGVAVTSGHSDGSYVQRTPTPTPTPTPKNPSDPTPVPSPSDPTPTPSPER